MFGREHGLRPLDRRARRRVEIREAVVVDRADVVVAEHGRLGAFADQGDAGVGVRSVPDRVAQTQEPVLGRDARQYGLQRFQVAVYICYNCVFHS